MKRLLRLVLSLAFWPMVAQGSPSSINPAELINIPVEKYKLKNGLTVLLHENHSAPIYSFHQWYRVGSRNEKPSLTGLAHFFEHLMFKGTKKYSRLDFEKLIKKNGGSNNAFTSNDYTGYYENMPSGTLELILKLESDRMQNLVFDEASVQSEREVVKEERRMRVENSVQGSLWEAMVTTVYKKNNYRWPVIGSMADLNAATMDDLKSFYKTYYAPNNTVIIITGSFDSSKVKKWIEEYYGNIPSQVIPKVNVVKEPIQTKQRVTTLKKKVQAPSMALAFKTTSVGSKDLYALDLLSVILGTGSSSRLYKDLVYKKQKALSVGVYAQDKIDTGIFSIHASLAPGANVKEIEREIFKHLSSIIKDGVSEKELTIAKNYFLVSTLDGLKTMSGRARSLAFYEIVHGDYKKMKMTLAGYMQTTAAEVQRVAKLYFSQPKSSLIQILPKK